MCICMFVRISATSLFLTGSIWFGDLFNFFIWQSGFALSINIFKKLKSVPGYTDCFSRATVAGYHGSCQEEVGTAHRIILIQIYSWEFACHRGKAGWSPDFSTLPCFDNWSLQKQKYCPSRFATLFQVIPRLSLLNIYTFSLIDKNK